MVVGENPKWNKNSFFNANFHLVDCIFYNLSDKPEKLGKRELRQAGQLVQEEIIKEKPKFILLVGGQVLEAVLGEKGIAKKRGCPITRHNRIYFPILPPNIIFHREKMKEVLVEDLKFFHKIVECGKIPEEEGLNWTLVDSLQKFDRMVEDLKGVVSLDIETNGLYPWKIVGNTDWNPQIQSIGIGTKEHQWCLPINHPQSTWKEDEIENFYRILNEKLEECFVVTHNGKFDCLWLRVVAGVDVKPDFDTLMAHYLIDENKAHGLKLLAQSFFGAPNYDIDREHKIGNSDLFTHCKYLAHDVFYTRKLKYKLEKILAEDTHSPGISELFYDLIMPIIRLFIDIEFYGVPVNVAQMAEVRELLTIQKKKALVELDKWATDVNWRSSKQLAEFFFGRLKLKSKALTPTGKPSTSASVLKQMDHPVAKALLRFREADKNYNTFIEGWTSFLDENNHMHPSFKIHGTVTGRPSCEEPNLQQVPRNKVIRSLIDADEGWVMLEFDLSQIEMRLAAELSMDPELIKAFDQEKDVHWLTATREVFRTGAYEMEAIDTVFKVTGKKVPYSEAMKLLYEMGPDEPAKHSEVWSNIRKKAKAINFGYLYGMWWKKFKEYALENYGVSVSDEQAQKSRETFFGLYQKLGPWHRRQKSFASSRGYVRSLSGRKRRLPEALSIDDTPEKKAAQRQAINSPVQSLASDLNLMILLEICGEYDFSVFRPIGTIHDAILAKVKAHKVEEISKRILQIAEGPQWLKDHGINLRVKLKGEVKIGPWGKGVECHQYFQSLNPKLTNGVTVNRPITTSISSKSKKRLPKGLLSSVKLSTGSSKLKKKAKTHLKS